jgi:hypothetical protein
VSLTVPAPTRQPATRRLGLLSLAGLAVTAVVACSSAPATSSRTTLSGSIHTRECTTVADMLSDGPDPTADPAGYAEAQVLPLRQLKITDERLASAVSALATAYEAYATSAGAANTTAAVQASKAEAAVNAICPGAAN